MTLLCTVKSRKQEHGGGFAIYRYYNKMGGICTHIET
jgi:hypothetical protein